MSDPVKKAKKSTPPTESSMCIDIANSIESIAQTLGSINQSHFLLLKLNNAVATLASEIEKEKQGILHTSFLVPAGKK